jgi:Sec-independent protein translocase protein TatA
MDLFGVGPLEFFFVIILALIILGPKDMQKAGRSLGRWMNNLVRSDTWKIVRQASNRIKYLPNELMREAGLEDIKKTGKEINQEINKQISPGFEDPFKSWKEQNLSLSKTLSASQATENIIDPPHPEKDDEGDGDA